MGKAKKQKNANKHRALSAQQTIPYIAMHPDGICQIPGGLYTKTLEYEDINYAVASTEDQSAIISGWSACLNYFDSSLPFQLSFVNRRSRNANRYKVNIPAQEDDFNSIRGEYVEMLKGQIAKSNNGIERYKYITFGLPAAGVAEARPRLGRVEADVMGNLKRLGVQSRPLDGRDRLAVLHGQMHPGGRELFRFAWKDIPKTGMGTKDYIAPDSLFLFLGLHAANVGDFPLDGLYGFELIHRLNVQGHSQLGIQLQDFSQQTIRQLGGHDLQVGRRPVVAAYPECAAVPEVKAVRGDIVLCPHPGLRNVLPRKA